MLLQKIGETRPESRIADNFRIVKTRIEVYKNSFIPSSVSDWNNLELKDRNIDHCCNLLSYTPNYLFYLGECPINIIHAQLRMKCSNLNDHLFKLHVIDSPLCVCKLGVEDSEHYLFTCPLYFAQRNEVNEFVNATLDNLLYGDCNLDLESNINIFKAVHVFINDTKRFD